MCGILAAFGGEAKSSIDEKIDVSAILHHRGPDSHHIVNLNHATLVFNRLAIMDTSADGNQPFESKGVYVMCNGEIYNWQTLRQQHIVNSSEYRSKSDCEILLHMYLQNGHADFAGILNQLRGDFALIVYDTKRNRVYAARDPVGVRPLFFAANMSGSVMMFASEAKALQQLGFSTEIQQFPAGHYMSFNVFDFCTDVQLKCYWSIPQLYLPNSDFHSMLQTNIPDYLRQSVRRRIQSDRVVGCLLSGGLDSSLVAALITEEFAKEGHCRKLHTFSVGMPGSTDLEKAREVALYIGSEHHEICLSEQEFLENIPDVVRTLESFDITTVRASVGMYLVAKYIAKETNVRVIFSGEGSDEVCQGYMYFHLQPNEVFGDAESRRLIRELPYFDVLRADRTTAAWGLELRVPFLDRDFIEYYLSLPPKVRCPIHGIEKYLLRIAFDNTKLLPKSILWRKKEAFSDGVSSVDKSWYKTIQQYVVDQGLNIDCTAMAKSHLPSPTSEASWYRSIFQKAYPDMDHLVPHYWMPQWTTEKDPSARQLSNYSKQDTYDI